MPYTWVDGLKDFLGAAGAVLVALPWILDFGLRRRREELAGVRTGGALENLKSEIEASLKSKIEAPKVRDLILTLVGLLCVFASFVIALLHGVFGG